MINEISNSKFKDFLASHANNLTAITSKFSEIIQRSESNESKSLLYELSRETINKEFNLESYLLIIDSISKSHPEFLHNLVDVLWLLGFILEKANESETIYSNVVNQLLKRKVIRQSSLFEKLEESSLFDCGLIQDKKMFKTKITRINTKITYEQQKFNLLREESEGFAKLIFWLFQVKPTSQNLEAYIDKILCLIGFFDLDPNRVLDIVLSAFQTDPENLNYLGLIKLFNRRAVPHLIGFKLTEAINSTDEGLFTLTAQLIKFDLLDMSEILPHLSPSLKETEANYKAQVESTGEFYKSSLHQRVSKELTAISTAQAQANHSADVPTQNANYFVNFREILNEGYKAAEVRNQIYKLFEALIRVKAAAKCEELYALLENFYDPLVCPSLSTVICQCISWMIHPIYSSINKKIINSDSDSHSHSHMMIIDQVNHNQNDHTHNTFRQIHDAQDFMSEIPKILKYLTLGLSTDGILFQKLLIILKSNCRFIFERADNVKILTDLLCKVFLPSLSLIDPTPALINNLWSVVAYFDYSRRYKIYNYWMNNIYSSHPALYLKFGVVLKETSKWHKTLSKENQRAHGRTLGILSNANPTIVFDNVIRLLTSYDNQINVFMQTLSFCSNLSYDVITFIISKILADPNKEKLNEVNGDMNSWFKYFAYFIGHYFKKFHFADFSGILYFLCNRLKNSNNEGEHLKEIIIEQYVLKEIVEKMSGILILEEMNETQIHACAGGSWLYLESLDLVKDYKNLKKPIGALLRFLLQNASSAETEAGEAEETNDTQMININGLNASNGVSNGNGVSHSNHSAQTLSFTSVYLILLGNRRQNVIFYSKYTKSKLLGYLYDQIQNAFVQLVQFLSMHCDRDTYARLLPPWRLEHFVINYNCPPEVVFFLNRSKYRPLYEMSKSEYSGHMSQFAGVLDTYQSLNRKVFEEGFDSSYLEEKPFLEDIYRSVWKYLTPELYFVFSALQLKDIYVPLSNYEKETEKNQREIERLLEEAKTGVKNAKEIDKLKSNNDNLEREKNNLVKNHENVLKFLEEKKAKFLDEDSISKSNRRDISRYLIQYCLYPRIIFSKIEAVYAAKMLVLLINLKIQNVNVFDIMQKTVKFLLPCILCLTEFEAQNLGVFLLEFLKVVKYWQEDSVWENECFTNPSFSRNLDTASPVDLTDFKKVIVCLLSKMNSTFLTIFSGDDYMSCRNAIIVLNTISLVYPPTKEIANELTNSIEKAFEKFVGYEDLTMMLKRYRDILLSKKANLPMESEITGESKEGSVKVNGEKKKKKEKKRDETSKTPDIKKRSPEREEYRSYKNRK